MSTILQEIDLAETSEKELIELTQSVCEVLPREQRSLPGIFSGP
jgi:hypothetical protein